MHDRTLRVTSLTLITVALFVAIRLLDDTPAHDESQSSATKASTSTRENVAHTLLAARDPSPLTLSSERAGDEPGDCTDVLGRFARTRDELRSLVDAHLDEGSIATVMQFLSRTAATPAPSERVDAGDTTASERFGPSGGFVRSQNRHVLDFERLKQCASLQQLAVPLQELLATTLIQETRPPLRNIWFACLATYDSCDPLVIATTMTVVDRDLELPCVDEVVADYTILLTDIAQCACLTEAERGRLFDSFIALVAKTRSATTRISLFTMLSVMFPYSPSMATFLRASLRDGTLRFPAVELLDLYDLSAIELEAFFSADPPLLADLIGGRLGQKAAWAFYRLVVQDAGEWGAEVLIAEIERPDSAIDKVALVTFLGSSASFPWTYLRDLAHAVSDDLKLAALGAIGSRARTDDGAYSWLRGAASDFRDPDTQVLALRALQMAGRDDLAEFIDSAGFLTQGSPVIRAQAAATYAFQAGADLARLREMADAAREPDPDVRLAAASNYVMARRDLGDALDLIEEMHHDPVFGDKARIATMLYLESQGTPDAMDRARQLEPTGYSAYEWAASLGLAAGIETLLEPYASDAVGEATAQAAERAALSIGRDSPLSNQLAGQAWLNQQLHDIAKSWLTQSGTSN